MINTLNAIKVLYSVVENKRPEPYIAEKRRLQTYVYVLYISALWDVNKLADIMSILSN